MAVRLDAESTLTDRYQTTIPEPVRKALKLQKRDKIRFILGSDGVVTLERASPAGREDPAVTEFLQMLAEELAAHPDHFRALNPALVKRARVVTKGMKVNPAEPPVSVKR
jgi:antitoxin PrlF